MVSSWAGRRCTHRAKVIACAMGPGPPPPQKKHEWSAHRTHGTHTHTFATPCTAVQLAGPPPHPAAGRCAPPPRGPPCLQEGERGGAEEWGQARAVEGGATAVLAAPPPLRRSRTKLSAQSARHGIPGPQRHKMAQAGGAGEHVARQPTRTTCAPRRMHAPASQQRSTNCLCMQPACRPLLGASSKIWIFLYAYYRSTHPPAGPAPPAIHEHCSRAGCAAA